MVSSTTTRFPAGGRATNPVFGDRKLKLGTFQTNLDSGSIMSHLEGRLEITWPNTVALARLAEDMDFEALVPVARWRGFGGETNPSGPGFETFSWAAGIAASTEKAGVFATSHISMYHPIVAAKQATAIDHISGGRFTLNLVTGWNKPEIEMFGTPLLAHDDRYDMAEEWLLLLKRLWSDDEEFDFAGRFFNIKKGYLQPKPIQKPYPAIMNAGGSERGRHFAAKNCDIAFVVLLTEDFDECRTQIDSYRRLAREEYGRELRIWSVAYVVQRETEREARDFYNYYVNEIGDWAAADGLIATMGLNAKTIPPDKMEAMKARFIAGGSGYSLIGTKEQVTDGLLTLSKMGLDGVLLSWPTYLPEMQQFRDATYPLLEQAGLR